MTNDLFSRNTFYIDEDLQAKIAAAKIAFLGTGLSSTVAETMVRTGFSHLFLCDGDSVETSNLNRQNFVQADLGTKKSIALKNRLKAINPELSCTFSTDYMKSLNQFSDVLESADIIVNTIDCGSLYFEVIETYRNKEKLVICPFNPGFGGLVVCFTSQSTSAFDFFETDKPLDDFEIARCLLKKTAGAITKQVNKSDDAFLKKVVEKGFFPQLGIGAHLTAAIATAALVKYLNGTSILLAPNFYYTKELL